MADDKAVKATEKAKGAAEGAASVAEAVKRVADAAVAEVQKVKPSPGGDFIFTAGSPTGSFRIDGQGFSTGGTVKINGVQAQTTAWGSTRIEGKMPAGARAGVVVVEIDEKTKLVGQYKG